MFCAAACLGWLVGTNKRDRGTGPKDRRTMASPQLSIVIPAYNEGARIVATLERVMACVAERGWDA